MIENKERAELAEQLAEVEREIYSLKSSLKGVESHFHNFTTVTFNIICGRSHQPQAFCIAKW